MVRYPTMPHWSLLIGKPSSELGVHQCTSWPNPFIISSPNGCAIHGRSLKIPSRSPCFSRAPAAPRPSLAFRSSSGHPRDQFSRHHHPMGWQGRVVTAWSATGGIQTCAWKAAGVLPPQVGSHTRHCLWLTARGTGRARLHRPEWFTGSWFVTN